MASVMLNGRLVDESQAVVSVFDRAFLYGDGLFETMTVWSGRPFRWEQHLERLQHGAEVLRLRQPFSAADLEAQVIRLVEANQAWHSILRLSVSRGVGQRGYSPVNTTQPVVVLSTHALEAVVPGQPSAWRLHTASTRLPPPHSLAAAKTACKLAHIVARIEAHEQQADEALLLDANGQMAECAAGNLFWWQDGELLTPPLATGALPGITRRVVLELAQRWGWPWREALCAPEQLREAEGVFACNSVQGVMEIVALDGQPLPASPRVPQLHTGYWASVARECETRRGCKMPFPGLRPNAHLSQP